MPAGGDHECAELNGSERREDRTLTRSIALLSYIRKKCGFPNTIAGTAECVRKLKSGDARAIQKENPYDTWSDRSYEANSKHDLNASNRVWRGHLDIGIRPKFSIQASDHIFAIGSCFAREIEEALVESRFSVPTCCDQDDHQGCSLPENAPG
jgi:hypothetical protein